MEMEITLALFIIICLSILLFFVYHLLAWISNICTQRKQRSLAIEESKRKVIEEYRSRYLGALKEIASKEKREKIDIDAYQIYIKAVKELCDLPENNHGNA